MHPLRFIRWSCIFSRQRVEGAGVGGRGRYGAGCRRGRMLVDTNRAVADKKPLIVAVTVKILLFLFHIRPKSLTLQPDKETNNAKTDLFYRLCLAPCLVR